MATATKNKTSVTLEDILGPSKKPIRDKVPICQDSELSEARDEAAATLQRAEAKLTRAEGRAVDVNGPAADVDPDLLEEVKAAQAAYDDAKDAADEASLVFHLRALGGQELADLIKAHPPTDEQAKEFQALLKSENKARGAKLPYDPDKFPPALVAAACIGIARPGQIATSGLRLTYDQAVEMWESENWSSGELGKLFEAADGVNGQVAQ